jgi:hypothetical protein
MIQMELGGTQKVQAELRGHFSPFASTGFDYIPQNQVKKDEMTHPDTLRATIATRLLRTLGAC